MKMGNVTFEKNVTSSNGGTFDAIYHMVIYSVIVIIIAIIIFVSYHIIKVIRFRRRYR